MDNSRNIRFMIARDPFKIEEHGGMYKVTLGKGNWFVHDEVLRRKALFGNGSLAYDYQTNESFGDFDDESSARHFAFSVREELDRRDGVKIDKNVAEALAIKLRSMGISVSTDTDMMKQILEKASPVDIKLQPVDRDSVEYRKMISDRKLLVEERMAEIRRLKDEGQSPKSDYGNSVSSLTHHAPGDKQPFPMRIDHASGVHSVALSSANIGNNIPKNKNLAIKLTDFMENLVNTNEITLENYPVKLKKAMGLKPDYGVSQYVDINFENEISQRIRTSDHEGTAKHIIIRGGVVDKGISVVLDDPNSESKSKEHKFEASTYYNVKEYIYKSPSKQDLINVTKSIFGLFEFGEYIDLANANKINVSPKPRGFKEGEFYGFVYDNTIYLNPEKFTAETPIHEYTHLWAEALRQRNPNEWKKIVGIMKEDQALWDKIKETYPHLRKESDIADEVLATYSGRKGFEKLREVSKTIEDPNRMFGTILMALSSFWDSVKKLFDINYKNRDDIADRVLYDFLSEINPLGYTKEGVQKLSDRMILGQIKQSDTAMKDKNMDNRVQLYDELSKKLAVIMPKHGDGVYLASPLRVAEDTDKPIDIDRIYHDLGKKPREFICANMYYHIYLSDMNSDDLKNLTKVFDEKLHTNTKVAEAKFNKTTSAAKEAIHDRIVTPTARWFTDDQTKALKNYSEMFPAEADTKELFTHLHEEVCKQDDIKRCPEKWRTDALKELNELSEGITRNPSKSIHV